MYIESESILDAKAEQRREVHFLKAGSKEFKEMVLGACYCYIDCKDFGWVRVLKKSLYEVNSRRGVQVEKYFIASSEVYHLIFKNIR